MPESPHKERTKFYGQIGTGIAFFSFGKILSESVQMPIVGVLAGVEGLTLVQNILGKDIDTNTFATACLTTGASCFLIGGSATAAAPYLFAAGFLVKAITSSVRAYRDSENRKYHFFDAGIGFIQSAGTAIGVIGGIEEKANTAVAGAASLLGGIKSFICSFEATQRENDAPYRALTDSSTVPELHA